MADSHPSVSQGHDTGLVDFIYSADGNRVVQLVQANSGPAATARTLYVGMGGTGKSLYERTVRTNSQGTTTEHSQFIYAGGYHGGSAFALKVTTEASAGATTDMKYFHTDHLGSVTAISNEYGHVVDAAEGGAAAAAEMDYDAWGARRNSDGTAPASPTIFDQPVGNRGFTGHETIPSVGLVNMNGRVYDPVIGRFLSPDPNVQFASNYQSYNRYSYVLNNPLSHTDPTGYFTHKGDDWAGWSGFVNFALGAVALAACVGQPLICAVGFALAGVAFNSISMHAQGMQWGDAIGLNLMTAAIGFEVGAVGGAIAKGMEAGWHQLAATVVTGAIGATAAGAFAMGVTGHFDAEDLLAGAAQGAMWAAVGWAAAKSAEVAQAKAQGTASGAAGSRAGREASSGAGYAEARAKAAALVAPGHDAEDAMGAIGRTSRVALNDGRLPTDRSMENSKAYRRGAAIGLGIGAAAVAAVLAWPAGAAMLGEEMAAGAAAAAPAAAGLAQRLWDVHPRVWGQLADPRLGNLANQISPGRLQSLVNSPNVVPFYDMGGYINAMLYTEGQWLRMTVAFDQFKIISVGPIQLNGFINGIMNSRFLLIGGGGP